ncbi:uncharacterized protein LOC116015730 [Ipomoea triloba]|uniref:uncharacterized protein LOC116015730 n=1 Tax=Ipomoea triloba TaxID=35885 RepID=UPI00125D7EDD|nr:uncharacterized protein LOC116015730 [Ipomoea triloba]
MATTTTDEGVAGLSERWADMVLEDEDLAFEPVGADAEELVGGLQETWSVVGRFLTKKFVKLEYMRQVMASVWKPVRGVTITELQPNLFLFVFFHITDMQYVLEEGPWSFENSTLICRQVKDGVLPGDVALDSVDMWVQIHDLPMGYTSDVILEQIGNFLGAFVKGDDRFAGAPWLNFYRTRVFMLVSKPLKRRMKLLKRDRTWSWVSFKYERLHSFCFYCGMMGHSYKFCLKAREATIPVDQFPFSAALRAGGSRGPKMVGDSWLVPVGAAPRSGGGSEAAAGVDGSAVTAPVTVQRQESAEVVVAVTKRRREGGFSGSRRSSSGSGSDVTMHEVSKNLYVAGSGSQTRPSS